MCGIAGILAYGPGAARPDRRELVAIRDHMAARGPDGVGEWSGASGRLILGHRRLSILDLSERGDQPMLSADGELSIVFNGEIYNYPSLRASLERDGAVFRTTSDTEAILHLYKRNGLGAFSMLQGMFAIAIWDEPNRRLIFARDPYGIKPLYYSDAGGTLRFASQVKALLAGAVDPEPDPAGIVGFCLMGSVPDPFTWIRAVKALPAGHTLSVTLDEAPGIPKPFASVADVITEAARGVPPADALEVTHAALRQAVADHLLADVEVGVFLSSGVDSGAILALMRDAGKEHIRAITLAFTEFAGLEADEAPLAADVARHYGAEHIVRRVDAQEFRSDLPRIIEAMDQPSVDGINAWFVSKAAREAGLKVALSGLGGDELLGGYSTFSDVPKLARMVAAPAAVPGLGVAVRRLGGGLLPGLRDRNPKALSAFEYGGSFPGAYFVRRGLFLPHELPDVLGRDVAADGLARLALPRLLTKAIDPDPCSPKLRVAALEAGLYMRNQLLRDSDWAGMAHSLEIRTPLVHFPLLQAVASSLPVIMSSGKDVLARAPSQRLPRAVTDRRKTGFAIPTRAWMDGAVSGANDRLVSRRWARTVLARGFGDRLGLLGGAS